MNSRSHELFSSDRQIYSLFILFIYNSKEQLIDTTGEARRLTQSWDHQFKAAHIITPTDYGIDLVAVMQLPNKTDIILQTDHIVYKIKRVLLNNNDQISFKEIDLLDKTTINVTIYSNISVLDNLTRISDVLDKINHMKADFNHCDPVTYHLRPTEWLNFQYKVNNTALKIIHETSNEQIEQYLL